MTAAGLQIRGGAYTPVPPAPSLRSLFGYIPGTLNMVPGFSGCDGKTYYGVCTDLTSMPGPAGPVGATVSTSPPRLSPDGTFNTQKLVENSAGGAHEYSDINIGDLGAFHPIPFRVMAIAKADGRNRFILTVYTQGLRATDFASVGFNLLTGQTFSPTIGSSNRFQIVSSSTQDLGNGYYACFLDWKFNTAVTGTAYTNLNVFLAVGLDNGSGTAAPSTSYVGDGVSGIQSWLLHMLPSAAWTFNPSRVFHDDFDSLSTIDVNDTRAPGFNWYVHNDWPHRIWNNDGHNPTLDRCPASAISISQPSTLKIYNLAAQPSHDFGAEQWNSSIMTAAYAGGTGLASVVGQYFGPPMVMDASYIFDDRPLLGSVNDHTNNCAFWGIAIESLISTNLGANSGWVEWDISDTIPGFVDTSDVAYRQILAPAPAGTADSHANMGSQSNQPQRYPKPLRMTGLWLDTAHSGAAGWGLMLKFFDGTFAPGGALHSQPVIYSSTALARPSISGTLANFIGWGMDNEAQHLPMIFWGSASPLASLGTPVHVDWVSVWK